MSTIRISLTKVSKIVGLSFLSPLGKRSQTTCRNKNTHQFPGRRIHEILLLKIRLLTSLGLHLGMTNVIPSKRRLTCYFADS